MIDLLHEYYQKYDLLKQGGGLDKLQKQREKGKMTAWERVEYLLDEEKPFVEIGSFAADGLYEEHGGCPNAAVIVVMGYVQNRLCIVVSNDASVKAGAWFPMTCKKNLRAQEIAIENHIPIIYLVDSAGVFLPMQDEIFPDKEHFGRIFRNNAQISSLGIPQIAAIMGSCVAGGAYLPIMSDYALIVEGTGSVFLAGSYLVKSSIGEVIDNESLGGAAVHSEISGVTDNKYPNDESCLDAIKQIIDKFAENPKIGYSKVPAKEPEYPISHIYKYLPEDRLKPYNMLEILKAIVDIESLEEYKKDYGKTIICALARIDGWAVGIVANQREVVKAKKPGNTTEMQMGGVIYSDSADKAARFIMNCNQQKIPLVFFQDITGFMVGSRAEHAGIIKDGAKLVNAMANSIVPKFTFIIGNSYGAGNYAMCGKAFDPRFIYAWPTAQIAVMSGASAGKTLVQIQEATLKSKNIDLSPEDKNKLLKDIEETYKKQLSPYYAASRLWVDGVIDPVETRKIISMGIEAACHQQHLPKYNVGIIQT